MRKTILLVEVNLDTTVGGSHHCLLELVRSLPAEEFRPVVVFYRAHQLVPEFEKICAVKILEKPRGFILAETFPNLAARLPGPVLRVALMLQRLFNLIIYSSAFFLRALRLARSERAVHIHLNNAPTLNVWILAALLLRIPCTAHLRGFWYPRRWQEPFTAAYRSVLAISHSVLEHLETNRRFPRAAVIHDGIDVDAVRRSASAGAARVALEVQAMRSGSAPLLGLSGNITRWKGQHVALEAVQLLRRKFPGILLLVIGDVAHTLEDERYMSQLRNFVEVNEMGNNVRFLGYRDDVPALMAAVDIVLHTSVDPEPLGRVILEGMSLEKPVIATRHGGPCEIIEHEISGLLINPDDPRELAEAVTRLAEDRWLAQRLAEQGLARVRSAFSLPDSVTATLDALERARTTLPA